MIPAMHAADRLRELLKGAGYYIPANVADLQHWFDEQYPQVETHMRAIAQHRNDLMAQVAAGEKQLKQLLQRNTDLFDQLVDITMWRLANNARQVVDFAGEVFVVESSGYITHATRWQAWLYRRLRIVPKPNPIPAQSDVALEIARKLIGNHDEQRNRESSGDSGRVEGERALDPTA